MDCRTCVLALTLLIISVTQVSGQGQVLGKACTYWAVHQRNGDRRPCFVGFVYNGVTYTGCTSVDHDRPWCTFGQSYPYNNDFEEWGNCEDQCRPSFCRVKVESKKNNGLRMCAFPFKYNDEEYEDCTYADYDNPWCSISPEWNDGDDWGICPVARTCIAGGDKDPECRIGGTGSVTTKSTGPGLHDETCHFPFWFDGVRFDDCTCEGYFRPWCSITRVFDTDFQWGVCKCLDSNGDDRDLKC